MATAHITPLEEWRDIPGWEGYYQASDRGRIRSVERYVQLRSGKMRLVKTRILSVFIGTGNRPTVTMAMDGKKWNRTIHTLVALAFLGPRPDGMDVCHNNGDNFDNRPQNLRYDTKSANMQDQVRHGTHAESKKAHCPRNHPLALPNLVARQ